MRILHVTDCYLPRLGGIETHVQDLVTQQRAEGHDAGSYPDPGRRGAADPEWVTRVSYPRVSVTGAGGATPAGPRRAGRCRRRARPRLGGLAVHLRRGPAGRARSVPTLVTVHSLWSHLGRCPRSAARVAGLAGWPVQWSAVSEAAAAPVRRALGAGVQVLVLPNAVDPARLAGPAARPRVPADDLQRDALRPHQAAAGAGPDAARGPRPAARRAHRCGRC